MACAADGSKLTGQLSQQSATQPELGQDLSPLDVNAQYLTPSIMRVKIGLPTRHEVPPSLFNISAPQGETSRQNEQDAIDVCRTPHVQNTPKNGPLMAFCSGCIMTKL